MSGGAGGGLGGRSGKSFVRAVYASEAAGSSSSRLLALGGDELSEERESKEAAQSLSPDEQSEKELCGTGGRDGEVQQSGLYSIPMAPRDD